MAHNSNVQFLLITILLMNVSIVRLSQYVLSEINECTTYHSCVFNESLTNGTVDNITEEWLLECFDATFCQCTGDNPICTLEASSVITINFSANLVFYLLLIYLLCWSCKVNVDIFDSREDYRRFKIKVFVLLVVYLSFLLLNIFAGYIVQKMVYHRNGFQFRLDFLDFIWISFAILIPVYFTCYLRMRSPVFRYIYINRMREALTTVEGSEVPNEECPICLESFISGSASQQNLLNRDLSNGPDTPNSSTQGEIIRTHCNHYFHYQCLRPALIAQNSCPMCRETIYREEQSDNPNTQFTNNTNLENIRNSTYISPDQHNVRGRLSSL